MSRRYWSSDPSSNEDFLWLDDTAIDDARLLMRLVRPRLVSARPDSVLTAANVRQRDVSARARRGGSIECGSATPVAGSYPARNCSTRESADLARASRARTPSTGCRA